MNTRTTIILLVVALALGGGVLFMLNQEQKASEQETTAPAGATKDLFSPKPAGAVQLRIELAGAAPRVFELRKDDWFITEPVKAQAVKATVESDTREITDMQYVQKFEAGAKDMPGEDLTGLKTPNVILTLKDKDGAGHTLKVGNLRPLSSETYVAKDNDPAVYVVKQNLVDRFAKTLADYREKRVTQIPSPEVTRVEVQGVQGYTLVNADGKWVLDKPIRGRTDLGKVSEFVQAAANISADNFVVDSATNLRNYGLDKPQLKIAITSQKKPAATQPTGTQPASQPAATQPAEIKTTTLLVGAKVDNKYYAKIEDEPSVFQIPESTFKSLGVALLDLRDKAIAGVESGNVETVELDMAGQTVRLAKAANGAWLMTGAGTGKAELSAVDDLLKAITQTKAVAFEDDPNQLTSYGFEKPRARVKLTASGQVAPVEILLGANTPSGEMVFVKNMTEGTIAVLKKSDADALIVDPGSLLDRSITTFAADDVHKIEISRDGRKSVLVRGQDKNWKLAEPVEAPADRDAVQSIVADLSNLRARKVVATDAAVDYGFQEPAVVATVYVQDKAAATPPTTQPAGTQSADSQPAASQPAEKVYTLLFAHNAKDGTVYARLQDRDWTYQLDPVVNVHLGAELHDRSVLKFETEQVSAMKVPGEKGEILEFGKQGDRWVYLPDPYLQVDAAKVKEYLGSLREAKVERFIAYNMAGGSDYGLDKPLYETEITLDSGKALKMTIAKATDTGKFVATIAGTTAAFELPAGFVQQLRKPLSFFKGQ